MITMTPELVEALAKDAGNRSMRAGCRDRWSWQDWVAAHKAALALWSCVVDD